MASTRPHNVFAKPETLSTADALGSKRGLDPTMAYQLPLVPFGCNAISKLCDSLRGPPRVLDPEISSIAVNRLCDERSILAHRYQLGLSLRALVTMKTRS